MAIFAGGLVVMIVAARALSLDLWHQILILAPAVAALGLPHGALDMPMAQTLWPLRNSRERALFFASYLALAGAVGLVWWIAPGVALAVFLGYSALHFSGDWLSDGWPWRLAGGLSAIGAPAVFHLSDVAAVFAVLGPVLWATAIAQGTAMAGLAGAGCMIYAAAVTAPAARRPPLRELAAIWIGAALLPPLLYFVAYFCLLHSLRHLTTTLAILPDRRAARRAAAAITAVSLFGAGLGLAVLMAGAGGDLGASLLQVVFISLAALTVPHMILVERFTATNASAGPFAA